MSTNSVKNTNPLLNQRYVYDNFYDLFSLLMLSDIELTNEELSILQNKMIEVLSYTKDDFLSIRSFLTEYRDQIADKCGIVDVDFDDAYNRIPVAAVKNLDITDILNTQLIQESIKIVNYILFNMSQTETQTIDPFLLAKLNANNPDFNIKSWTNGNLVAFHYGDTLQDLAYRYLGNRDSWLEIAIANGLEPPYIDELGSNIYIINAYDNKVVIPQYDPLGNKNIEKVYDYQPIFIKSNTQRANDQRLILNIQNNPLTQSIILTLDGVPNLNQYTVTDSSYLIVYKKNTINSNFMILIPSIGTGLPVVNKKTPWFLATSASDEKNAGIDIYMDENKEIYFTSNGDVQLSYGLTNAIQAIIIKLTTVIGSIPRHPDFGLDDVVGLTTSQSSRAKDQLISEIMKMIQDDNRFDRLEKITAGNVNGNPNQILISLVVRLAGSNTPLPITYTLNL